MSNPNLAELAAPFHPDCVHWKPQQVSGNRALAVAYVDARDVCQRLDDVVGPANWRTEFDTIGGGEVRVTLCLKIDGEWVPRQDVGTVGEGQGDASSTKAAVSDGIKRAAVQWGIGRYLYRLPNEWCDFDQKTRRITSPPRLPEWAIPDGATQSAPKSPPPNRDGWDRNEAGVRRDEPVRGPRQPTSGGGNGNPANGRSLFRWIKEREEKAVKAEVMQKGQLVEAVAQFRKDQALSPKLVSIDHPNEIAAVMEFVNTKLDELDQSPDGVVKKKPEPVGAATNQATFADGAPIRDEDIPY
mgnify:FL=1